jgi:hypothetical protein
MVKSKLFLNIQKSNLKPILLVRYVSFRGSDGLGRIYCLILLRPSGT